MDEEAGEAECVEEEGGGGIFATVEGALGLCCLGLALFPISLFLLGWNEERFVCENSHILFAEEHAKSVGCSSSGVANEFAFFSCPLQSSSLQTFTPCSFNQPGLEGCNGQPPINFTSVSGSQTVEMYQCQESCATKTAKNSLGQNVKREVCTYGLAWATHSINSKEFVMPARDVAKGCPGFDLAGRNPVPPQNFDMGESVQYATGVLAGTDPDTSFELNRDLVTRLHPDTSVSLQPFAARFAVGTAAATANTQPWARPLKITAGNVMISGAYLTTCAHAALGCVRVSYARSNSTRPSVMTRVGSVGQTAEQRVPGSWGCPAAGWQAIVPGEMSKGAMVESLQDLNHARVWLLRLVGLVTAWLAIYCCFQPIAAGAQVLGECINWLPCGGYVEDFLEGIVTSVLCVMSCSIGCSSGLFVIAVVWLFMRPLFGGALMAGCVMLCICAGLCHSTAERRPTGKIRKGSGDYEYSNQSDGEE